jgi:acyl-CoA synthetase (AMP-forming)/AMP-acid ligase II
MDRARESQRREEARDALRGELREVVGDEAAERAERKGALDSAIEASRPKTVVGVLSASRVMIAITLFTALIVGAVIALITGSWLFLLAALVLHAIGTVVVVATGLSLASQSEAPDPRTAAALEARGVSDPEGALNEAVRATSDDEEGGEAARAREDQTKLTPSRRSRSTGTTPERHPHGGRA